jgi:hypothetical protein
MAGWLGGLEPVTGFNPLLQMASGIHFRLRFASFVLGTPAVFSFDEIRETQRLMESGKANGKIVVKVCAKRKYGGKCLITETALRKRKGQASTLIFS